MLEVYRLNVKAPLEMRYQEVFLQKVSEEKCQKIRRYKKEIDGRRTLLGEILIKVMLSKHLNKPVEEIVFKQNEYGKPYLENENLYFNISHSGEWVVGAISNQPVGIDVEEIKSAHLDIAQRFFTNKEYVSLEKMTDKKVRDAMFYRLWSGKESYIKMIGKGLNIPLKAFELEYMQETMQLVQSYEGQNAEFITYELANYSLVICCSKIEAPIIYETTTYQTLYDRLCE